MGDGDGGGGPSGPPAGKKTDDATLISVSSSLEPDLHTLVQARAKEEDRTVAVVVRRAVKQYMKGWKPDQDSED